MAIPLNERRFPMTDEQYRQALALFRYGLIAEFTHLPAGGPGLYARLREKAQADYVIPGTTRTRVAPETLRHWLKDDRRGGFDALLPKGRADRGRSRALPEAVADALLTFSSSRAQPRSMPMPTASCGAIVRARVSMPIPRLLPRAIPASRCVTCVRANPTTGSEAHISHPLRLHPLPLRARALAR